jgi:hypothetical protein
MSISSSVSFDVENIVSRLDALETRECELAEALLDYLIADLAAPWVPAAKRLEAVLVARLSKELKPGMAVTGPGDYCGKIVAE